MRLTVKSIQKSTYLERKNHPNISTQKESNSHHITSTILVRIIHYKENIKLNLMQYRDLKFKISIPRYSWLRCSYAVRIKKMVTKL